MSRTRRNKMDWINWIGDSGKRVERGLVKMNHLDPDDTWSTVESMYGKRKVKKRMSKIHRQNGKNDLECRLKDLK